jgi:AbrB family looped-hinge helix DNA binding protein
MLYKWESGNIIKVGGEKMNYVTTLVLDDKGRITIPVKVREFLSLQPGEMIHLSFEVGTTEIKLIINEKGEK